MEHSAGRAFEPDRRDDFLDEWFQEVEAPDPRPVDVLLLALIVSDASACAHQAAMADVADLRPLSADGAEKSAGRGRDVRALAAWYRQSVLPAAPEVALPAPGLCKQVVARFEEQSSAEQVQAAPQGALALAGLLKRKEKPARMLLQAFVAREAA